MLNEMISIIDQEILKKIFRTNIDSISTKQKSPVSTPRNIRMKHDDSSGIGFVSPPQAQPSSNNRQGVKAQPIKVDEKIGRNDPCPCGSEKKYKKCCGRVNWRKNLKLE